MSLGTRLRKWTRTQRTRTAAELPVSADLVDNEPYRKYVVLAPNVLQLTQLGMTQAEIAKALGTTPRTVRRAMNLLAQPE